MNLEAQMNAIVSAISAASGIPASRVAWAEEAKGGRFRSSPWVDLTLSGPLRRGWDELRGEYDEDADTVVRALVGPRELRIDVRIESTSGKPGQTAHQWASTLATRLQRESVLELLSEGGLALATIGPSTNAIYNSDDRKISVVVFEIVFNALENDRDDTDSGERVEHFIFQSDSLTHPDGTTGINIDLTVPPIDEEE